LHADLAVLLPIMSWVAACSLQPAKTLCDEGKVYIFCKFVCDVQADAGKSPPTAAACRTRADCPSIPPCAAGFQIYVIWPWTAFVLEVRIA